MTFTPESVLEAAMSVPSSVEELLQLIRKSGMADEQKLSTYLHRRQAGRGLPADPRDAVDAMVEDGLITGFQAEQFLLGKWRGFTIGKYQLLERIGVGGMGQVFLCEHTYMKRRVAIKVLPPAKARQPAAVRRFYREARAAGSIEHANIVRTYDIDQDGDLHYIVMEYVEGSNLFEITKKFGPLDIGRVTSYIKQVADGLDYAFRNGIIHRDIKPGNILVDRFGRAKLLDMGLARFYNDHSDNLTLTYDDSIVLGTADYVAPEQIADSHSVDIRADIYALGASFYFMLAGHPPFPSGTVSKKLLWHRTKEPTPIRKIRPEVPEGIAAVVTRMMHKDPNQRYQTPAELAAILEQWVPAQVPLPAAEEMPQLSRAALEGVEPPAAAAPATSKPATPANSRPAPALSLAAAATAAAEARARTWPFAPSPFGPRSDPQDTPEPPALHPVHAYGTALPARGQPESLITGRKSSVGLLISSQDVNAEAAPTDREAAPVYTSENAHSNSHPRVSQGFALLPASNSPPPKSESALKTIIFFGFIATSLLVAVALIIWK